MIRRGFTLLEVNLAMFIMAVGTLGLVALYSFGYRENQQSVEDVEAAAVAQMHLNTMVAALSSTNISWSTWESLGIQPANGWAAYLDDQPWNDQDVRDGKKVLKGIKNPSGVAKPVFDKVVGAAGFSAQFDDQGMKMAIVITPSDDYRTYSIAIRCGRRSGNLVYQPLYYTEVCYQGFKKD